MMGRLVPLWESMLACIKLGAVIIPVTTLLSRADVIDRVSRGRVKAVIAHRGRAPLFEGMGLTICVAVGGPAAGWIGYALSNQAQGKFETRSNAADATMLLYFTSGTTSKPRLVAHSHVSYPMVHLSTAHWIGLIRGDVHLNLSSPGCAKHAWSCFFALFNAEAGVVA